MKKRKEQQCSFDQFLIDANECLVDVDDGALSSTSVGDRL